MDHETQYAIAYPVRFKEWSYGTKRKQYKKFAIVDTNDISIATPCGEDMEEIRRTASIIVTAMNAAAPRTESG